MPLACRAHFEPVGSPPLAQRTAALVRCFETIARTRMAGLPLLNPVLAVEAIGFEALPADEDESHAAREADTALGILVTPWFMNLVALPLHAVDSASGVGRVHTRRLRGQDFEFIGAHEPALGAFEACSLFSPMFEFVRAAAARDTAREVLALLREPQDQDVPAPARAAVPPPDAATPVPARRAFLFGRSPEAVRR